MHTITVNYLHPLLQNVALFRIHCVKAEDFVAKLASQRASSLGDVNPRNTAPLLSCSLTSRANSLPARTIWVAFQTRRSGALRPERATQPETRTLARRGIHVAAP